MTNSSDITLTMSEKDLHLPKIAMRIRAQAALRNMKQLDLAKYLKIAPATMSQKLNGKIRISADELNTLADCFNVSTDYLLGRQTHPDIIHSSNSDLMSLPLKN